MLLLTLPFYFRIFLASALRIVPCKKKKKKKRKKEKDSTPPKGIMRSPGSISGVSPAALPVSGVRRFPTGRGQQGRVERIVPGDPFALAQ